MKIENSLLFVFSDEFMNLPPFERLEILVVLGYDQMPWWKGVSLATARALTEEERATELYAQYYFMWETGKNWDKKPKELSEKAKRYWNWEQGR